MVVVHVFPEEDLLRRDMHLKYWFGVVRPDDAEDSFEDSEENPVVCWCGGKRVDLSDDVMVCYHIKSWPKVGVSFE
jgi:hypothetical protein